MILSCHKITKAFGGDVILKDASFGIEENEKAAVVGINGAGKSTLLKILIGEMPADDGEVVLSRGKTIGYLAQQKMVTGERSIYEELRTTKQHIFDMEIELRNLEEQISRTEPGDKADEMMERYHQLTIAFEQQNGYQVRSEIAGVLKGLGFSENEFDKPTSTLSGGQRTRIALGRLLLSSPDIILLDEPTNHLDLNSIRWLETYLLNYRGTVIIVAHDRYFLDKVVTKIIEIDRGEVMTFMGNYSDYAVKKRQLMDIRLKAWMKQQQIIRHQEEVITKLRSFNREKSIRRAESREKMLEKMDVLEKPSEENSQMHLMLQPRIVSGNDVLTVEHLSRSFGHLNLFTDVEIHIRRGERVALIGDNGTGKTTLLKIINGLLKPDTGTVSLGTNVVIGYYDQEHQVLHSEKTLFDELSDAYPTLNNTQIRDVLAAFLFTGDDVFKRICDISGGERGRVSLAKLMLSEANFLILDEPTNHLDIISREILENALRSYTGTVLYVSHDRYFINQTATRILDLENNRLTNYLGDYDYYLEKHDELTARLYNSGSVSSSASPSSASVSGRDLSARPADADAGTAPGAASAAPPADSRELWLRSKQEQAQTRKRLARLKQTEDLITGLEERDREIDELLAREEIYTNVEQVRTLTAEKAQIAEDLEKQYELWEELSE